MLVRLGIGNRITEKSLPLFLSSLEMQGDGGGLLRLRLQVCGANQRKTLFY